MRRRYSIYLFVITSLIFIVGCAQDNQQGNLFKVGMMVKGTVEDNPWNDKGYKGLLAIEDKFDVEVEVIENVETDEEISKAVSELVDEGVNLIIGHSSIYGEQFYSLAKSFPDIHFIYTNGNYYSENLTSLTFNSHAMGFFAGMIASQMSKSNEVGIIAAYQWQPEIEGFYEGVKFKNANTNVNMEFIYDWNDKDVALRAYNKMKQSGVDVIYPAGDDFSEEIIKQASEDQIYAIGFVSDQYKIEPKTVLTSTVQHVDRLYVLAAEKFHNGTLKGEIMSFDFKDDLITLGEYSEEVPKYFQKSLNEYIEEYKKTGLLPNQY
ncbi:BMP family ABC transporter substrate-binding protein [Ornithinibacillus scapharcae]|uniref:BMP family ABC transporter substrate-binding protein n=1 Tax=Ornithinibacillus scapharcae TaxID=1147159 RepID=UPI000225B543|nr:BMP family ABC transporter substrate-binding protein [Ornithinibacillus scapharcae]